MEYWEGEWRVANDSIFLNYEATSWGIPTGPDSLKARYRFNDKNQLCISYYATSDTIVWYYYDCCDNCSFTLSHDTTTFRAEAIADTIFPIYDTILFTVKTYPRDKIIPRYYWSTNSGLTYTTTNTPWFKKSFSLKDTGFKVGAVKIESEQGELSQPDYFDFRVSAFRPAVTVNDTIFYLSQSKFITANAVDLHGKIVRYSCLETGV